MKRLLPALLAALLLAACSSGDGGHAAASSSAPTSALPLASTGATVTPEPYDVYVHAVIGQGLTPEVQQSEAVSVAGNTCDNTVADFRGLIGSLQSIYPTPAQMQGFVTDRALFIDAYCPGVRPVFDAATQAELGYVSPVR